MDQYILPKGYVLDSRYEISEVLSQGGFGITYKAKDNRMGNTVCIKELFISGNSTRGTEMSVVSQATDGFVFSDFVDRFIEEAQQLSKFKHNNIVSVMDVFKANNTAYMVMEFVKGETLKALVERKGGLVFQEALPLVNQLLDAVEEVHAKGMLHRDIKPENILVTAQGRLVLIDFGSAREFVEGKTITQTAILTPGYAPMEQYSLKKKRGSYTDIYAIGATLYFMLTGKKPLAATDRMDEEMKMPHQINPTISTQVSSAIMLAMQMKVSDRFQSVAEFRSAMISLQNSPKGENSKSKSFKSAAVSPKKLEPYRTEVLKKREKKKKEIKRKVAEIENEGLEIGVCKSCDYPLGYQTKSLGCVVSVVLLLVVVVAPSIYLWTSSDESLSGIVIWNFNTISPTYSRIILNLVAVVIFVSLIIYLANNMEWLYSTKVVCEQCKMEQYGEGTFNMDNIDSCLISEEARMLFTFSEEIDVFKTRISKSRTKEIINYLFGGITKEYEDALKFIDSQIDKKNGQAKTLLYLEENFIFRYNWMDSSKIDLARWFNKYWKANQDEGILMFYEYKDLSE